MTGDIRLTRRRIEIDGEPRLVLAGEVHYFRLARHEWEQRLDQAAQAGLDTIATYIPWIWHELPDGSIDLTGASVPERDIAGFLDLCAARGLRVFARPGPFVMAELKNEGIPYRIRREHPHLVPVGWDGAPAPTRDLDYLHPDFLAEAEAWYDRILPVLAERQLHRGGPVMAVQIDNEVGMLAWVSNTPHLTDDALAAFAERVGPERLRSLTGSDDPAAVRAGGLDVLALHHELGLFARHRFATYLDRLAASARRHGVEVPLAVNVHGTGGGRGTTYPIGVSQLAQAYRGRDGVFAGSDYYLGELTVTNIADLYLSNAIMTAVNGPDQPMTSLEFEAGTGNYGEDLSALNSPESAELKTLLTVAQGGRLINYYLFAGGRNPRIEVPEPDGTERIAFTGERHGFAAPVDPEGEETVAYGAISSIAAELRALEPLLAAGEEEHDDLVFGFVADHYLTEYRHPASAERAEQAMDTERHRGAGFRDVLGRALVLAGFRFGAVDLQALASPQSEWATGASDGHSGVAWAPELGDAAIVLSTGRTLGAAVQRHLADHVLSGGRLVLTGLLPDRDDDGQPCSVLADALGLRSAGIRIDAVTPDSEYWPTVRSTGPLGPLPDVRVGSAQLLEATGTTEVATVLTEFESETPCAVLVRAGAGRALVLGCDYPVHLDTWRALLALVDVRPGLTSDAARPGLVATTVATPSGERALVALNVAPYPLEARFALDGEALGEPVRLPAFGHLLRRV